MKMIPRRLRRTSMIWRAPSPKRLWTPRNKIKKMNCGGEQKAPSLFHILES